MTEISQQLNAIYTMEDPTLYNLAKFRFNHARNGTTMVSEQNSNTQKYEINNVSAIRTLPSTCIYTLYNLFMSGACLLLPRLSMN